MIPAMILPLSSPEATLALAGGKGANLASLTLAGFEVPPGFIVTTDAYRLFVDSNAIGPRLLEMAEAVRPDDLPAMEAASEGIRALFTSGTVPAELAAAIQEAYLKLPHYDDSHVPVAVRSSATAEDLPGLSFAGQQDTYLNVIGPTALIEAVKSCWGSLWTARAMGYRARNRIAAADVALAVVVQQMIPSEVSGVLFTVNPLSGHRGEMVIDASFGLGEAIVSGQVEPDHYVVSRRDMHIVSRKLGAKALAILPRNQGGTESVPGHRADQQSLTDPQIIELARLASPVEDHFGSPQDIEWAWDGGRLYMLQSRPITSLYPVPESLLRSEELRVLFSLNSIQGVMEPFTPLGSDLFPLMLTGILRALGASGPIGDTVVAAGGRLHIDVTVLVNDRRLRRLILAVLSNADPGARQAVMGLISSGRIPASSIVSTRGLLRLPVVFRPVIAGIVRSWLRPKASRKRAVRRAERLLGPVRRAIRSAGSLEARLAVIDKHMPDMLFKVIFRTVAPAMVPGIMSQVLVARMLTAWAGAGPGAMQRLLRGLPGNPTTEMDLRLWAAAEKIRSDAEAKSVFDSLPADDIATAYLAGDLSPVAQEAIDSFMRQYGMRAVGEIDMGRPRWREDPRSVIQSLSSFLQIGDPDLAPDRLFRKAGEEAETLATRYVAAVQKRKGRLRARLLGAAIRRMRLLSGLREMPKFYIIKLLDLLRTAMLDSGRTLVAQGKLDRAEDIFFVPLDTLRSVMSGPPADLKAIVERERADYERERVRRQIPRVLLSTGEVFYQGMADDGAGGLVGDGVSPGAVEGRVRVVLDPRGAQLEPGEILVCPATDPGWTPLFLAAGGLVMEMGGMITHGSVVAREYGIPAVVGVHEATRRLKTGQLVRVDGSAGRVVVIE